MYQCEYSDVIMVIMVMMLCYCCLVVWLFGYLVVWLFGYLVVWLFGCCLVVCDVIVMILLCFCMFLL